ncbi:MAG TPA: two-component sensor histidine kinase, partial [Lachnospiraceae bacterium]|nr:two-component sensor histidine kinase [Lachnospiraceae bacterium]
MKHTLYLKFILAYCIFGFLSFVAIATFTSELSLNYLIKDKATAIYKEANLISNKYAANFYSRNLSEDDVTEQLDAIDTYLSSAIWIINSDGNVIYSSRDNVSVENPIYVEHFDPTDTGNEYYMTGNFYGLFDEDVISVLSPITSQFRVRGYVVIHS